MLELNYEMLPLPHTLPDDASAYEMLSVVEDINFAVHVNFAEVMDYAESWGTYLAHVAYIMTRDHADYLYTVRPDGDLFAAMCDGFKRASMEHQQAQQQPTSEREAV
jgi:hypothetical protein